MLSCICVIFTWARAGTNTLTFLHLLKCSHQESCGPIFESSAICSNLFLKIIILATDVLVNSQLSLRQFDFFVFAPEFEKNPARNCILFHKRNNDFSRSRADTIALAYTELKICIGLPCWMKDYNVLCPFLKSHSSW